MHANVTQRCVNSELHCPRRQDGGEWSGLSLYWPLLAAVLMAVVPSTTQTFTPSRPKRSASYHDDEDAFAGYGAVDDGGSDGSGGDTGARAGGRRDEISLPRKSPGPRRLPAPRLSDDEGV